MTKDRNKNYMETSMMECVPQSPRFTVTGARGLQEVKERSGPRADRQNGNRGQSQDANDGAPNGELRCRRGG